MTSECGAPPQGSSSLYPILMFVHVSYRMCGSVFVNANGGSGFIFFVVLLSMRHFVLLKM